MVFFIAFAIRSFSSFAGAHAIEYQKIFTQDECTFAQYQKSLRGDATDVMTMAERTKLEDVRPAAERNAPSWKT